MRQKPVTVGGQALWLALTGEGYIRLEERGGIKSAADLLTGEVKDIESLWQVLLDLIETTELARRFYGYAPTKIPTLDDLRYTTSALELSELRAAAVTVIIDGMRRETDRDEDKEVDLGLIELERQKRQKKPEGD